jgi:hypothetical protein
VGGTLGDAPAAANIAVMKCSLPWKTAFVRAVMGNWIVCMSILMATGSSSLASKMVAIFFPISAFVMLGLEHSIANLFVIPLGIMRGSKVSVADFLWNNLLPVTLGKIYKLINFRILGLNFFSHLFVIILISPFLYYESVHMIIFLFSPIYLL